MVAARSIRHYRRIVGSGSRSGMAKTATLALLLLAACAPSPSAEDVPPPHLELSWRLEGLANPESVALSEDGTFLYVGNVNGEADAKDGNGFIARVSLDGTLLEREWVRGLDAPKGLALASGRLYAADIDQLVVIDADSGAIVDRIPISGAIFLNDIAVARNGAVLIADSGAGRIYAVEDGPTSVWLEHAMLDSVNGLLAEPTRLIVTTMAGRLLAIDYRTKAITTLAEGLGDADGVAALPVGRYLVSQWPGVMHVVNGDGTNVVLFDTRDDTLYLNDFLLVNDTLYQPHWEPSALSAYRVIETR
jgi:DNA-binding beta-propeller fold protein YncE